MCVGVGVGVGAPPPSPLLTSLHKIVIEKVSAKRTVADDFSQNLSLSAAGQLSTRGLMYVSSGLFVT